jgi:hypothetical protein
LVAISFDRNHPGVRFDPPSIATSILVIQNLPAANPLHVSNLTVKATAFTITDPHTTTTVPFAAITKFYDPTVPFMPRKVSFDTSPYT